MANNKLIILVFFIFLMNNLCAQSQKNDLKDIKSFVFISIITDGAYGSYGSWDGWKSSLENHYKNIQIENTQQYLHLKPNFQDSISGKYTIQLFRIRDNNSKNQHRYLMRYDDFDSGVWLRISGYVENDVNLLFDYLRKQKISKRQLKKMIQTWIENDSMFEELELNCLFEGYIKNKTKSACFNAVHYIRINDSSIGYDELTEEEWYATFARVPLYGRFRIIIHW